MATINITDLKPIGTDLFMDSESFMNNLTDDELGGVAGGKTSSITWTAASSGACVATITLVGGTIILYQLLK
jgi:hypothetical protein